MREVYDEMEEQRLRDNGFNTSSDDSPIDEKDDVEKQKLKKLKSKRKKMMKGRYLFKIKFCGHTQRVDKCLMARLMMGGVLMFVIISMLVMMYRFDQTHMKDRKNFKPKKIENNDGEVENLGTI